MKVLRNFSRLFVGLIFVFSGFVKVIDPLGSAYKFTDYFMALHLEFLSSFALVLAIIMSVAELIIGIALIFNLLPKLASWGVLLFMGFFTPLTLWLAVANPVSDCGCFGDALILTNWQTFYKNLIILAFVIFIFIYRKRFKPAYNEFFQWILAGVFTIAATILSVYCLRNLPIIDFRPFHIGANIKEGMTIPEDQLQNKDVYNSSFIYEKDGKQQEFTAKNLPDSTWKFIDAKHELLKEGYKPPIHDFTIEQVYLPGISPEPANDDYVNLYDAEFIYSKEGNTASFIVDSLPDNSWIFDEIVYESDLNPEFVKLIYLNTSGSEESFTPDQRPDSTYIYIDAEYVQSENVTSIPYNDDIAEIVLADENYSFLLVMTYVNEVNAKYLEEVNNIAKYCKANNYNFYCLTGSNVQDITAFVKQYKPQYSFFTTDPITLKTIIRSNPGLVLLKKGTVIDKWAGRNLPKIEELKDDLGVKSLTKQQGEKNNYLVLIYILSTLLFMLAFHATYKWLVKNKFINF